jgi:hypothetical protein
LGEAMDSKRLNARDISRILGIDEPRQINGGTVEKEWVVEAVSKSPGCEEVNLKLNKILLLESAVLALGGEWDDTCYSEGSTIRATGLSRFAICLEPRLSEMREISSLLGKGEYPEVDHDQFASMLYAHYFNRERSTEINDSLSEILGHINSDLGDEEIYSDGKIITGVYQEILINLLSEGEGEVIAEDDADNDHPVKIISTEVEATQIVTLINRYRKGILNVNPPWQRGDVWSRKQKRAVIESILLKIPLPAIILHTIRETGKIEVIDGQQRLRSIMQFVDNEWPLPKFDPNHDLHDISGCYWDKVKGKKKDIGEEHRLMFEDTKVPILMFKGVDDKTLRKVFNLYNTSTLKLNAAEIRNATYQNHPLHRMAFIIAGENRDADIYYLDKQIQMDFTREWRELGSTKRFAATELICQYFAYSRPKRSGNSGVFKGKSTSNCINLFLDLDRNYSEENITEMAQELIDCYEFTLDNFDLEDDHHHPFSRNDKNGVAKFNKLVTITNMVVSRMLLKLIEADMVDEELVEDAIETVIPAVEFPENQNAVTMWSYQADVINNLLDHLEISSDNPDVINLLPDLIPCMDEIRTHSIE